MTAARIPDRDSDQAEEISANGFASESYGQYKSGQFLRIASDGLTSEQRQIRDASQRCTTKARTRPKPPQRAVVEELPRAGGQISQEPGPRLLLDRWKHKSCTGHSHPDDTQRSNGIDKRKIERVLNLPEPSRY